MRKGEEIEREETKETRACHFVLVLRKPAPLHPAFSQLSRILNMTIKNLDLSFCTVNITGVMGEVGSEGMNEI